MIIGGFSGIGLMSYYILRAPLTKKLYFETFKSAVFGILIGSGYFRV
jgi:hypothetical protein